MWLSKVLTGCFGAVLPLQNCKDLEGWVILLASSSVTTCNQELPCLFYLEHDKGHSKSVCW